MRHIRVPVCARLVVEAAARSDVERLGHVDLDVVDVIAVPDRLEQPIREPQREDVLRRLLAEEVVDPEDLGLVEDLVHLGVQLLGALEVGPERLLHDHAGAFGQSGFAQRVDHVDGGGRRHAQVIEAAGVATKVALSGLDGVRERRWPSALRHVAQLRAEVVEGRRVVDLAAELLGGVPRQPAERVVVDVLERRADDPAIGNQPGLVEVEQAR